MYMFTAICKEVGFENKQKGLGTNLLIYSLQQHYALPENLERYQDRWATLAMYEHSLYFTTFRMGRPVYILLP